MRKAGRTAEAEDNELETACPERTGRWMEPAMLPGPIARARVRSLVNCREFGSGGQIAIVVRVLSLDELSRGGKTTVHDLETDE